MAARSNANLQRTFYSLAILLLVVAALYWAEEVLLPFALALLLAFILSPLVSWVERRGPRRAYAVLIVTVLAFGVLAGLAAVVSVQVRNLALEMPKHRDTFLGKVSHVYGFMEQVRRFEELGKEFRPARGPAEAADAREPIPVVIEGRHASVMEWLPAVAGPVARIGAHLVIVVMLVLFMLIKRESLRNRLIRMVGHGHLTTMTKALDDAAQRVSRYLLMQLTVNSTLGLLAAGALFVIGVPYALLWGLLASVLRFVPYVGIWLAALLPVGLELAIAPGWTQPVLTLGVFVVLEVVTSNAVEPVVFGHSTGVSPVALLVAAVFWTWVWGPLGLVLSTPLTVCLVVLGKYVPYLEFLDVLLGDEPVLRPAVVFYQRLLARDQDEAAALLEHELASGHAEAVYDDFLMHALVRARRGHADGELTDREAARIERDLREVVATVVHPQEQIRLIASGKVPVNGSPEPAARVRVVGCPARDGGDELALNLLQYLVQGAGVEVDVLSTTMLTAEVIAAVERERPDAVCVAALPPGGLAHARNLCKRLRARCPDLKIVVGRWGEPEDADQAANLRAAGADGVTFTLLETQRQLQAPGGKPAAAPEHVPAGVPS